MYVPSCNGSTCSSSSSSNKQQKKHVAAASSSCKTSPADTAYADIPPCRCLTQTGLASCSRLLRISTTIISPVVQSQLHRINGSTANKASSGVGREPGGVRCTDSALAAACCCCCKRAYPRRHSPDLRSYDALLRLNLALVVAVELRLHCWPGCY